MLDGGRILNCPLTGADMLNKADIHGKSLANLKGKKTKKKGSPTSLAVMPHHPTVSTKRSLKCPQCADISSST